MGFCHAFAQRLICEECIAAARPSDVGTCQFCGYLGRCRDIGTRINHRQVCQECLGESAARVLVEKTIRERAAIQRKPPGRAVQAAPALPKRKPMRRRS